jgi:mRNA-degrading endonuclease toxin of MazEF toxin-antitoxin module
MTIKRGEVWLADLNPIRGSEQSGVRPVLIFQNDAINTFTTTVVTIPRSRRILGLWSLNTYSALARAGGLRIP